MPAGTFLPPGLTTSDVKITSGGTDNYVMTAVDGETIQGEASLQFDGDDLIIANDKGMVVGDTAKRTIAGVAPEFLISGTATADSTLAIGRWSANSAGPSIDFLKSRAAAIGTLHADSRTDTAGDVLGEINFVADDGSGTEAAAYDHYAAQIVGALDLVTAASNDMPGRLTFLTAADGANSPTERMRIDSGGNILIGTTTANTKQAEAGAHLTLNQGASDDEAFALKSSDVAHARTAVAETDTFFSIAKTTATGGANMNIMSNDTTNAVNWSAYVAGGTATDDKTTGAEALINFYVSEISGGGGGNVAADGNVFAITARVGGGFVTRFLIDEDGDLFAAQDETTGVTVIDGYEDAHLVRAYDLSKRGKTGLIRGEWDKFIKYNEQDLIDVGVMGDTRENGGLLNVTGLQRLHNGAIWQGYVRQQEMQEKIDTLENRLLAIEGAK